MSVSASEMAELQQLAAALPETETKETWRSLESAEEVLGYLIEIARAEGRDEVHDVEMVVRFGEMRPTEVRRIAHLLRRLGYRAVSDMLRKLAGRRQHTLAPLVTEV